MAAQPTTGQINGGVRTELAELSGEGILEGLPTRKHGG